MKRRRVELWLAIAGFALLAPGAVWLLSSRLNGDDCSVAFARLARIPLEQLQSARSAAAVVTVPDSVQWRRIRREWGDPGYVLAAVSPPQRGLIYCFGDLGIEAEVLRGGSRIPLATATVPPYGFSTECQAIGLKFVAPPGSELTIRVLATSQRPLPAGELVLLNNWDFRVEDRIVGVMLDEDLRKVVRIAAAIGLIPILLAAWLVIRSRTAV